MDLGLALAVRAIPFLDQSLKQKCPVFLELGVSAQETRWY